MRRGQHHTAASRAKIAAGRKAAIEALGLRPAIAQATRRRWQDPTYRAAACLPEMTPAQIARYRKLRYENRLPRATALAEVFLTDECRNLDEKGS